jgi:2-oxoglutarate dehydrogenase E1 component
MVASAPREFAHGRFRMVIDDEAARARNGEIRRVVLCTGKMFVDIAGSDRRAAATHVALCRLEQLYPLARRELRAMLDGYRAATEIVWVQEEPENMGYWDFIRAHLTEAAGGRPVRVIARPRSASPAEGSAARHAHQQQLLVEAALAPITAESTRVKPGTTPKPEQVAG